MGTRICFLFVAAMAAKASAMRLGDPREMTTDIGPVISVPQRDKILGYIAGAKAQGANEQAIFIVMAISSFTSGLTVRYLAKACSSAPLASDKVNPQTNVPGSKP